MIASEGTVAVIAELSAPFDPITLYNRDVAARASACVDVAEVAETGLIRFLCTVFATIRRCERTEYLTRGYDRRSLFHLFLAVHIARLLRRPMTITLHSELFAFFGPIRSRHVGRPLVRSCFSHADRVVCGDRRSVETLRAAGVTGVSITVERLVVARLPEPCGAVATVSSHAPNVVAIVDDTCLTVIDDACRFARSMSPDTTITVLFHGDRAPADARVHIVEGPDEVITRSLLAEAALVVRPLRCMGRTQCPDDLVMIEFPRPSDGGTDFTDGMVVVRHDSRPGDLNEDPCDAVVREVGPRARRVAFLGVFTGSTPEAVLNRRIERAVGSVSDTNVQRIDVALEGFDSDRLLSFLVFARDLERRTRHCDLILHATQGTTRPSLLTVLTVAIIARGRRQRLFAIFHDDAFALFARMRSRNAGLPLLWTTIGIAERVFCSSAAHSAIAEYRDPPGRYIDIGFDASELELITVDPTTDGGIEVLGTLLTGRRPGRITRRPLTCDGITLADGAASSIVTAEPFQRHIVISKGDTEPVDLALAARRHGAASTFMTDRLEPHV